MPHGLANAVLLGRIVKWISKFSPGKVAVIENILKSNVDDFLKSCGINTSISSCHLTDDDIIIMADIAAKRSSTKATPGSPSSEELVGIMATE